MARIRLLPSGEFEIVNADGLGMKTDGNTFAVGSGTIDRGEQPKDTEEDEETARWSTRSTMPADGRSDAGS